MTIEIPYYGLKAYALFFSKHNITEEFDQSELDWIVSEPMKKKIFSLLLNSGWITKASWNKYKCKEPNEVILHLMEFRVPKIMEKAEREYAFTGLSAIEIWSDYCYIQRSMAKSPYFIKIRKKDLSYWKEFFNQKKIPNYVNKGTTIGEYVILIPTDDFECEIVNNLKVDPLKITMKQAKENSMQNYAYEYMRKKYGD